MSGLNSQFGYAKEVTYGTAVTPMTVFLPFTDVAAGPDGEQRVQGQGIWSGVFGPLASQYARATYSAGVSFGGEVQSLGMLPLFEGLMGADATSAQQAATTAYLHTMALGDPAGKSFTMQTGRAPAGASAIPGTVAGAKIIRASFNWSATENLMVNFSCDGKSFDNTTSLTAVAIDADTRVFGFAGTAVKMGTYGSETAVSGVRAGSWDIDRAMDTERYYANSGGYKDEPNLSELPSISGSLSVDWRNKTDFEDLALGTAGTSLVQEFVGALIESTYYTTFRFTLPGATFDPASQGVSGPGNLTNDWAWSWKYDGTNMPKIEVINTETSV